MRPFIAACLVVVIVAVAGAVVLDSFVQQPSAAAFAEPSARI
jgi:hypothetical protein